MRRTLATFVGALAVMLALPVSAGAVTVTLGQVAPPEQTGAGFKCGSCQNIQTSVAGAPGYTVPQGKWLLTSWSTRVGAGEGGGQPWLLLVEPASGSNYTLRKREAGAAAVIGQVNTYVTHIDVSPGWILGLRTGADGTTAVWNSGASGDIISQYGTSTVGDTGPAGASFPSRRLNIQATLESDNDDDNLGDDTQDDDDDNDGIADGSDAFPLDPAERGDNDADGIGDNADVDDDNDGVADASDNCRTVGNPDQADIDGPADGGNACDVDDDGDGQPDAVDADDDNDGVADAQDAFPSDPSRYLALATNGPDVITGTHRNEVICGLLGNDVLAGAGGNDTLWGDGCKAKAGSTGGRDSLVGGAGNDKLFGAAGKDALDGGSGDDKLDGGPGRNSYKGRSGKDTITADNGVRETVDCGSGSRDYARVDAADRVTGCETVRRRRPKN